jgi:hypothetical protein
VVELTVELELVVRRGFDTVLLYPYISRWSCPPHSSIAKSVSRLIPPLKNIPVALPLQG